MSSNKTVSNDFVANFRKSAPYIHAHRGKTFVVLFGGEAVADQWRLITIPCVRVTKSGTRLRIEK